MNKKSAHSTEYKGKVMKKNLIKHKTILPTQTLGNVNRDNFWPFKDNESYTKLSNFQIFRNPIIPQLQKIPWTEAIRYFLDYGLMAPTSHNAQQWQIKINELSKEVIVSPDPKYIGVPSDRKGRQASIGVGTFVENIVQALHAYDIKPEVSLIRKKNSLGGLIIHIDSQMHSKLQKPEIIELLKTRRVYRGPYKRGITINESIDQIIKNLQIQNQGIHINFITNRLTKVALGLIQFAANNYVLQSSTFRKELGEYMDSNDSNATRIMPGSTFGLNDEDSKLLKQQLERGGILRGAFAAAFPQSDKDAILNSYAIIIITVDKDSPDYWYKAGMTMERVWLKAQSLGFGVGVMAGMVEVATKAAELVSKLNLQGYPAAIMRIGIPAKATWPRSPRVKLEDILISE